MDFGQAKGREGCVVLLLEDKWGYVRVIDCAAWKTKKGHLYFFQRRRGTASFFERGEIF